jgi:long-chain fatty acid transport protein
MPARRSDLSVCLGLAAIAALLGPVATPARAQYGIAISGVGPINRSMGGAAVAAPLDSAGAIYWNPATISDLGSEMEFGTGVLIPRTSISSFVPAGALGNGQPAANLGRGVTTGGNNGVFLLPVVGLVYNPKDSPLSYGFGVFEIGGFAVNYPVARNNPILNPGAPFGAGIGPLYTQLQLFQFSPTVALKIDDQWSVGAQLNIDLGIAYLNPGLTSVPSLVQTPLGPAPSYGSGDQGRSRAGGGFQVGVYYKATEAWSFGAAIKSPQWFDTYRFNTVNPTNGNPATTSANINFPMTGSVGVAYKGIDRLLIASDFRILDYRDTNGFRTGGFNNQTGALRGLGWQNVFALGTGIQYQWTDDFSTRVGYTFNLNPIGPAETSFNVGSPLIIQHSVSVGGSYSVTPQFKLSLAYSHDFQNSISGPLIEPFVGRIAGSSVRTATTADTVYFGATVSF